jgi:hypothetical protein
MVIFSAVTMLIVVFAGFLLLFSTNWAEDDATDAQFYTFLGIIGLGVPAVWTLLNLGLLTTRAQTGGQYVAGLTLEREVGGRPSPRQMAAWWFCFNPLLFSWPMAMATGLPLAAVISLALSRATIVGFGLIVTFCAASPIIALISAMVDRENRALHDRVAGVVAVPSE